jgi:hypothetical protein
VLDQGPTLVFGRALAQLHLAAALSALAVVGGCGGPSFDVAPVRGLVTVDGKPMPQGRVMFAPLAREGTAEVGKPAYGVIQPDGTYVLGTFDDDDGAVVGEHWITIYSAPPYVERPPDAPEPPDQMPKNIPKFVKMKVPGGRVSVEAGKDNELNIRLTSRDILRYGEQDD